MSRVKRSVHARKKRRATLERAKGYRGQATTSYKRAKEALLKADSYAYRDRRNRKRDFRRLWITRINAAARHEGMTYSQFMHGLKRGRRRARPQGAGRHRRARPRDVPTFCRDAPGRPWLPDAQTTEPNLSRGALRGALFRSMITISPTTTSSRRSASSAQKRWREKLGPVRRRGRGPGGRRRAAGWEPRASCCARAWTSSRELLDAVSALGSGTRVIGVYEQRWAEPRRRSERLPARGGATPATSARSSARRTRSRTAR